MGSNRQTRSVLISTSVLNRPYSAGPTFQSCQVGIRKTHNHRFPALDGGHLVFLLYEGIFRREIPTKVKIALQQAGFILLLVFMAFVLYNDIARF